MPDPDTTFGRAITRSHPVTIAPMPRIYQSAIDNMSGTQTAVAAALAPYACQSCVRRKIKCNRDSPVCSSCTKVKLECVYCAPPPPRPRKRKYSAGEEESQNEVQRLRARLESCEQVLRENGLQPVTEAPTTNSIHLQSLSNAASYSTDASTDGQHERHKKPEDTNTGQLVSVEGESRYINSRIWLDAGENDMRQLSEDGLGGENRGQITSIYDGEFTQHPICDAFFGVVHSLETYHPSYADAKKLLATHLSNVEPLCKIVHIPTTANMVHAVSQQPTTASRVQECLLFSIYHAAILSMTDRECFHHFGQPRYTLLERYQCAFRQALVNASWLKTTNMTVLQAYVLFLIVMRATIDPHTFWILTGIAVRIAQRMGLHRDGEGLGLSPFDVEMRRRLFWQLVPLDSYAGQISGSGIYIPPDSWDVKQPLNINDDQLYPNMKLPPIEKKGASEMIFCLAKAELSNLFTQVGTRSRELGITADLKDTVELDKLISDAENIIEAKYLRYCDISQPLHFLLLGVARYSANMVRLRSRISPLVNQTITDKELAELCDLAHKILDNNNAIYQNPGTRKFHWQLQSAFLWDSLRCVLTTLVKPDFVSPAERDVTWGKIASFYTNHPEVSKACRGIQALVGKATLKAWKVNPPTNSTIEPLYITDLLLAKNRIETKGCIDENGQEDLEASLFFDGNIDALSGDNMAAGNDFLNLHIEDWTFWDDT